MYLMQNGNGGGGNGGVVYTTAAAPMSIPPPSLLAAQSAAIAPLFPLPTVAYHSAPGALAVGQFPNPKSVTRINHFSMSQPSFSNVVALNK